MFGAFAELRFVPLLVRERLRPGTSSAAGGCYWGPM